MLKKIWLVLVVLGIGWLFAGNQLFAETVIFKDDFAHGVDNWLQRDAILSGPPDFFGWDVEDGAYSANSGEGGSWSELYSFIKKELPPEFTLEVSVKPLASNVREKTDWNAGYTEAGIVFAKLESTEKLPASWKEFGDYIQVSLSRHSTAPPEITLSIETMSGGGIFRSAKIQNPGPFGTSYQLKLSVKGSRLKAYLNNELLVDIQIANLKETNKVGLWAYGSKVCFDDVTVTVP